MIPVERPEKPEHFDRDVGTPGNDWLAANPTAKDFGDHDYWKHVRKDLAIAFNDLCGYSAIFTKPGTVDHYISKESPEGRSFAYDWSNYRFASSVMNARKGTWNRRILDPFEIGYGWFEILLPTLEMIVVEEMIPLIYRDDAAFTLKTLKLDKDEEYVLEVRRHWYQQFMRGNLALEGLAQHAPLIARAVKKRLEEINVAALDDMRRLFDGFVEGLHGLGTLRVQAPALADEIDSLLSRPDSRLRRRS